MRTSLNDDKFECLYNFSLEIFWRFKFETEEVNKVQKSKIKQLQQIEI